jgi:hypothetical protein
LSNSRTLASSSTTRMVAGQIFWCWWPDSNGRPTDYESVALPAELHQRTPLISLPLQRVARRRKLYQWPTLFHTSLYARLLRLARTVRSMLSTMSRSRGYDQRANRGLVLGLHPDQRQGRSSDLSVMVCQDSVASIFARPRAEATQAAASRAALKNRGSISSRVIFWRIERA